MAHGGIAFHLLKARIGLIDAIDDQLHLLKFHLPYHESDHARQLGLQRPVRWHLSAGSGIPRRQDEVYLDALGARRIPDPTTAGDFCRRFRAADAHTLIDIGNQVRRRVWARQPTAFFEQATIDMDGTLVPTAAECKAGIDIAYNGTWGYHPLVVSLANTGEVLSAPTGRAIDPRTKRRRRSGSCPAAVCLEGGFVGCCCAATPTSARRPIWTAGRPIRGVRFIFGLDATSASRHFGR